MSEEPGNSQGTLAVFAGGGQLPGRIVEAALAQGRALLIIGMRGVTDPALETFPIEWWTWGEIGRLFKLLKAHECAEFVLIGRVDRPDIRDVKFDIGAVRRLPKILSMLAGSDGDVLHAIIDYLEQNGVRAVGAHEISPSLCMTEPLLGRCKPDRQARADILTGTRIARDIGALDIGQGVIVESGRILAVEAAEGTDAMIGRAAGLRAGKKHGRSGVLVKVPKPGQDLRVDMPTIGVATIDNLAAAGFSGIAVERGHTLVSDKKGIIARADEAGLFVATVSAGVS